MDYKKFAEEFVDSMSKMRKSHKSPGAIMHELMSGEYALLSLLSDEGETSPSKLSKALDRSAARIANTLKALENKGFVKRSYDKIDRRRVLVSITEKGKDFVSRKKAECTSMMASLMEHLGEKDAEELIRLEKKAAMLLHRKNKANEF